MDDLESSRVPAGETFQSHRRRLYAAIVVALLFVMPFVYDPAPAEQLPEPTTGTDCTVTYERGLGWEDWEWVEDCG